jgi:NitT/TauT family transport system substrate-binding protein
LDSLPGGGGGTSTVRHASVVPLTEHDALLFQSDFLREEVMPNVGSEYDAEWTQIGGTPLIADALGAQEQDIGVLAFSSMANALEQGAIPEGFTVISGCVWGGWTRDPPRYSNQYVASADSGIESIEDLEGQSVAINSVGAAVDLIARIALSDAGLDPSNDVEIREVGFGAIPDAINEGRVDCGVLLQPFHYNMSQNSDIVTVFDSTDAVENYQYLIYVVRDDFLDNNPELVEMWLEDYWEALQWWSNPDNREDMLDIAEEIMGLERSVADAIVQTENDYYHGENGLSPDIGGLEAPIESMVEFGFLDEMVDIESVVDDSYLPDDAQVTY